MTPGTEEIVVDRGVSRYGLHMVHVIRMGGPVEAEGWKEQEAAPDAELVTTFDYEEEELGMWHLWLYWKEKGAECYDGWIK